MGNGRTVRIGNIVEVSEKKIARAHSAYFMDIKLASGIYEISKTVSADYLLETVFTAIVH